MHRLSSELAVTEFSISNGSLNPSTPPKSCPQNDLNPSQYSEDCLSMLLYAPSAIAQTTKLPVFLWLALDPLNNAVLKPLVMLSQDPRRFVH
jgi:Carboxylesterase family